MAGTDIPLPLVFNPLKHHLEFIRHFTLRLAGDKIPDTEALIKELKHIGTSVMDIYTGALTIDVISSEVLTFLRSERLDNEKDFSNWSGKTFNDFRLISLSDLSQWTLKYHNDRKRYVHLFPARSSPHSFRVKANTLKSALLYQVMIGKDYITRNDLNRARAFLGLSPVKGPAEAEAITEMIEILRK